MQNRKLFNIIQWTKTKQKASRKSQAQLKAHAININLYITKNVIVKLFNSYRILITVLMFIGCRTIYTWRNLILLFRNHSLRDKQVSVVKHLYFFQMVTKNFGSWYQTLMTQCPVMDLAFVNCIVMRWPHNIRN